MRATSNAPSTSKTYLKRHIFKQRKMCTAMFYNFDFINILYKFKRNGDMDYMFYPFFKGPHPMAGVYPLTNMTFQFGRKAYKYSEFQLKLLLWLSCSLSLSTENPYCYFQ